METLLTANIWNFDNALLKAGKFCKKQFNAVVRTWILLKVGGSCLRVNDQYQQYLCRSVKVSSYKHQVTSLIFFSYVQQEAPILQNMYILMRLWSEMVQQSWHLFVTYSSHVLWMKRPLLRLISIAKTLCLRSEFALSFHSFIVLETRQLILIFIWNSMEFHRTSY